MGRTRAVPRACVSARKALLSRFTAVRSPSAPWTRAITARLLARGTAEARPPLARRSTPIPRPRPRPTCSTRAAVIADIFAPVERVRGGRETRERGAREEVP